MVKPNLSVRIGKLKLKNPIMAASGTWGLEYNELADVNSFGAIITKTITLKPRTGNLPPRVIETPSGMLNSIGLENKGCDFFLKNKMPQLRKIKVPLIISITGDDKKDFTKLARRLDGVEGISALELNLSCPNIKYGSKKGLIAQDEQATFEVVSAVRKSTKRTIIAKLSPNVTDIDRIAKSAEDAGADAVSLVNTFIGMAVDIGTKQPALGNVTGGLSGPAIRPLALRMVWEAYNKIRIPIIGTGGIMNYKDAIEFLLCGASALQIGTANFVNPNAAVEIVNGITKYLVKNKIGNIGEIVGALKV